MTTIHADTLLALHRAHVNDLLRENAARPRRKRRTSGPSTPTPPDALPASNPTPLLVSVRRGTMTP